MRRLSTFFILSIAVITQTSHAKEYIFAGQEFPPYIWQEGATVTGAIADFTNQVCAELKVKCKLIIAPTARIFQMMDNNEIDGALAFASTPEREKSATFSSPVILSSVAYFGTVKTPKITQLSDLAGWNVAAVRGSATGSLAIKHKVEVPTMQLVDEVNTETLIKKLIGGRYGDKGVIIGAQDVLEYYAEKLASPIEVRMSLADNNLEFAFSKKSMDATQLASFNTVIERLKKDGTAAKTLAKYKVKAAK